MSADRLRGHTGRFAVILLLGMILRRAVAILATGAIDDRQNLGSYGNAMSGATFRKDQLGRGGR
jgi:hypothetical protein